MSFSERFEAARAVYETEKAAADAEAKRYSDSQNVLKAKLASLALRVSNEVIEPFVRAANDSAPGQLDDVAKRWWRIEDKCKLGAVILEDWRFQSPTSYHDILDISSNGGWMYMLARDQGFSDNQGRKMFLADLIFDSSAESMKTHYKDRFVDVGDGQVLYDRIEHAVLHFMLDRSIEPQG